MKRAHVEMMKFMQENPKTTKVRLSTKNENNRWRTVSEHEELEDGREYRLQAFNVRNVIGARTWVCPPAEGVNYTVKTPVFVCAEDSPEEREPFNSTVELLPVDPMTILADRIAADGQRIEELHRVVLQLVNSVSTHAAGATGPLVKLIDQLTGSVTDNNNTLNETLNKRLRELDQRETIVIQAETEAEEKLLDADAATEKASQEGAVVSALIQQLGPDLLAKFTGSGGAES